MNLTRQSKLRNYEIIKVLDNYVELTDYQKSKLVDIDWYPFTIIKYEQPKPVKPIWRLTILFYWIYCLSMILIIRPVSWVLFGQKYFTPQNIFYRIYEYWTKKLGLTL